MDVIKVPYDGDIYFREQLPNVTCGTSLTKVYEYTAPCNGYVDLCICPIWAYTRPTGSSICTASDGANYNTVAINDDARGAVGCSVSAFYLLAGTKLYCFAKMENSTTVGYIVITGHFHPVG